MSDQRLLDLGPADVHTPSAVTGDKSPSAPKQPAAFVVVRNADGEVLSVSRPEPPHEMGLPGGGIEDGETAEQAACRECHEETGVRVSALRPIGNMVSPTDGRPVHMFEATSWTGDAYPAEPATRIQWLSPTALVSQAVLYRQTLNALLTSGALHPPHNGNSRAMSEREEHAVTLGQLDAAKRSKLKPNQFALPEKQKFPIHDPDHTRNAAARLAQAKKAGTISDADYDTARGNIRRAAKKFGIHSELKDKLAPATPANRIQVKADLAPGGQLHVRHNMTDRYVAESVLLTQASTSDDGPVWIQLAKSGQFLGHAAGPFELNTKVFREIVDNFNSTVNREIPIDYEHASEADATSGSIPTSGAPAQGWIKELKIENGNLYGRVEWGQQAKEQIRSGQYKYLSPAIRFGSKDRVTGRMTGARLSSAALTNQPFLDGMQPLAAKDGFITDGQHRTAAALLAAKTPLDAPVHSPHAYMPKLRAALKVHELSTPQECSARLSRIRDMCMSAGPSGMHSGVNLGDYTSALGDLVGATSGMTWQQVFDIVEDMIDAAIGEHVIEDHGGGTYDPTEDDDDNVFQNTDKTPMADTTTPEITLALKEAQNKASELATKLKDSEAQVTKSTGEVAALTLQLKESQAKATDAEAKLVALAEEVKTLKDAQAKRDEADLLADVDIALATYKDKKGLSEADKPHLLAFARSSREAFNKMYPPVAPEQRHLMRSLTPSEPREKPELKVSQTALCAHLMSEKGMAYMEASELAADIIAARKPNPFAGK